MADTFQPVDVYHPRDPKDSWKSGWEPFKKLTANTEAELEGLLRIGWTREVPQQ